MNQTANYNLDLPEYIDDPDVLDLNNNFTKIDTLIKSHSLQAMIVTLAAEDWVNNEQEVTVTGILPENEMLVFIAPAASAIEEYVTTNVLCVGQTTDTLSFQCDTVPENDLTIYVIMTTVTVLNPPVEPEEEPAEPEEPEEPGGGSEEPGDEPVEEGGGGE